MARNLLTDKTIQNAKGKAKAYRLNDGAGLYLLIKPDAVRADSDGLKTTTPGARFWRFDYTIKGRSNMRGYGSYPTVTLKQARAQADADRQQIAAGIDPVKAKRDEAAQPEREFRAVHALWMKKQPVGKSATHKRDYLLKLLVAIAPKQVGDIEAREVAKAIEKIEATNGVGTAHRALSMVTQVLSFAKSKGMVSTVVATDLREGLTKRPKGSNRAARTKAEDVAVLMKKIYDPEARGIVVYALKLLSLTMVRPSELRCADWSEFNLDDASWVIPEARMKTRKEHTVYLSTQAVTLLREMENMTGGTGYVFRNFRTGNRPISDNATNAHLRSLDVTSDEHCSHGFRSTASTLLNESGMFTPDLIEISLAHAVGGTDGKIRAIYNRPEYKDRRREMMQWLADKLDSLRTGKSMPEARKADNVRYLKQA